MTGEERNARRDADGVGEGWTFTLEADARLYNVEEPREATIVDWRIDCFTRAGLTALDSTVLAMRRDIERPTVERLLNAGATSAQVRELLT